MENWLTKKDFEKIDLREQLKKLKQERVWYVDELLARGNLRVFKHHVVYDSDFRFDMVYHKADIAKKTEDFVLEDDIYIDGIREACKGEKHHIEKGEILCNPFITVTENKEKWEDYTNGDDPHFYDYEEYGESPNDILNDILYYCYNCI